MNKTNEQTIGLLISWLIRKTEWLNEGSKEKELSE